MGNLIGFAGRMGAGKDTYGVALKSRIAPAKSVKYSFAEPVREELNEIIDLVIDDEVDYSNLMVRYNISKDEAEKIKSIIFNEYILFGRKPNANDKTKSMRNALQYWGTEVRRKQDSEYWIKEAEKRVRKYWQDGYLVYITDARFLNEFEMIKRLNGTLIYLDASEEIRKSRLYLRDGVLPTPSAFNHASEKDVERYQDYDFRINTEKVDLKDGLNIFLTSHSNQIKG